MHTAVVGAGPTGLFMAIALARRGHRVTVVDRDSGPGPDGSWARRGVMQFHHPHGFGGQVVDALAAEMPEVMDAIYAAGGLPTMIPERPGRTVGLRCRRATFEHVLRVAAAGEPGVELRTGHADQVCTERARAVGLVVDGRPVDADLVIDASGRAGRLSEGLRAPAVSEDCGLAYVSRQYELLPGADDGPVNTPVGMIVNYQGYQVIVFLHDNRTFSVLVARLACDHDLAGLRDQAAFDAACRAIPALAAWTDPDRSQPITNVLPGGRLFNCYQGQRTDDGRIAVDGLIFVGDAVCTTNPTAGRGVATSFMQVQRLIELLAEHSRDFATCSLAFQDWCDENIRPWFADHVAVDAERLQRWSGHDVDLSRRLTSDSIVMATEVDPSMMRVVGPYLEMRALPGSLVAVEPRAREIYAGGWRPVIPIGPTRNDLAGLITAVAP